ncbi:MAG TPA: hypothetical protein VKT82_23345 [Ktedonobacterales bacterium]|nr:hypothetical protein [Ktedonobacterales bacterium]
MEQRLIDLPDRKELADIHLQTAEEARSGYLVIPLATTNTHQAWSWGVEELPIECPIPLDEVVSTWMDAISPEARTGPAGLRNCPCYGQNHRDQSASGQAHLHQ